jgi:hypothetical protein
LPLFFCSSFFVLSGWSFIRSCLTRLLLPVSFSSPTACGILWHETRYNLLVSDRYNVATPHGMLLHLPSVGASPSPVSSMPTVLNENWVFFSSSRVCHGVELESIISDSFKPLRATVHMVAVVCLTGGSSASTGMRTVVSPISAIRSLILQRNQLATALLPPLSVLRQC